MLFLRNQESMDACFYRHDVLKIHIIHGIHSSLSICVLSILKCRTANDEFKSDVFSRQQGVVTLCYLIRISILSDPELDSVPRLWQERKMLHPGSA